ncbi:hypothetical protein Golob_000127, partial [Gossypium lobatum]|nr:hypothetical protein [Gossypium lobatum]
MRFTATRGIHTEAPKITKVRTNMEEEVNLSFKEAKLAWDRRSPQNSLEYTNLFVGILLTLASTYELVRPSLETTLPTLKIKTSPGNASKTSSKELSQHRGLNLHETNACPFLRRSTEPFDLRQMHAGKETMSGALAIAKKRAST